MPDMILSLEMLQCTCQKRPMPLWNLQSRCLDKWANEDMWLFQRVMSKRPYHGRHSWWGWCGDTCLRRCHLKENQNEETQPNIGWSEEGTQGLARAKARRRMWKVRVADREGTREKEAEHRLEKHRGHVWWSPEGHTTDFRVNPKCTGSYWVLTLGTDTFWNVTVWKMTWKAGSGEPG